jgi:hypothetical protein
VPYGASSTLGNDLHALPGNGDQGEQRKCHSSVEIVTPRNLPLQPCLSGMTAPQVEVGAMGEREELLSKLKRYLTIRGLIYDKLVISAIAELIRETEERLTQIENNVPDQKALQPPSGEVPL